MRFLIVFIILSAVNVVFSTIRSITTIKSRKTVASLVSGGYFAFYNIMLIYTVMDFPMWEKCVITFVCNVVGVWVVKWIEEKMRKDKLWKVEVTVSTKNVETIDYELNNSFIPHNYITISPKHTLFSCYCATQLQTQAVKNIFAKYDAKYFASESQRIF